MNILYLNKEEIVIGNVSVISDNLVKITGKNIVENTSGFHLVNNNGKVFGKYEDFTTVYKQLENGFIYSNDGSVYVEPTPEPEEALTFEELIEYKVSEMNNAQQQVIVAGVNVTLTDGSVEHFTLSDHDQTSLMALQTEVESGTEFIPWHNSNETEHCKFYANADMALITSTALNYVIYHVTYFRDLRIYVRSLTTEDELNAVVYGMPIPEKFQSEPLKAMMTGM